MKIPQPIVLIPALTSFYNIQTDQLNLFLNGTPLPGKFYTKDFEEEVVRITEEIIALVRKISNKE